MNSARMLRPRSFRPHLSARYQRLRRYESTAPSAPPAATPSSPSTATSIKKRSFFSRYRARIIWRALSLAVGLTVGNVAAHTISPPPMPQPGSHEDSVLLEDLNKRIDEEFKVKVLRGKCLGVAKQLKGEEGGWVEIVHTWSSPAASTAEGSTTSNTYLTSLRGARGLGAERIFWHRTDHKLVAVVHFGSALSGWPGVTHGGVLATALTEKMALAQHLAHHRDQSAPRYDAAAVPQRLPGTGSHAKLAYPISADDDDAPLALPSPTNLTLTYRKPTYANQFHVIRVSPAYGDEGGDAAAGRHDEWLATLEAADTRTCVEARGGFPAAAGGTAAGLGIGLGDGVQAARRGYAEFREWMWPSRQKSSQIT